MKKYIAFVFLLAGQLITAQASINQYQYVIVPTQFKFANQKDEYRLNTVTKLLLEKYGFKVYFDTDALPPELKDSKCDKLYANLVSSGNLVVTKLQVTLKDCKNVLVYQSAIGKSKENELKTAYNQALREAFKSFETLHYQYLPAPSTEKTDVSSNQTTVLSESFEATEVLHAEPISNGYQLVDSKSKKIMKIFKTSNPTMFSAEKKKTKGVLISKDNQWFFEYYQDEQLVSEKVNVKF